MRMRQSVLAAGAVALAVPGVALAASGPTIKMSVSPNEVKAKSTLKLTAKGPFGQTGLPTSLQMTLQKGFRSSAKSVSTLCDTSSVPLSGPSGCPSASQIGTGTADTSGTGAPGPLALTLYLGTKSQSTDIASVILSEAATGIQVNGTGRLFKTSSGQLEILFSTLPLGGLPVTLDSIKFSAFAKQGKHSLIKNPKTCPKSHHWKGTFELGFTGGTVTKNTKLACTK